MRTVVHGRGLAGAITVVALFAGAATAATQPSSARFGAAACAAPQAETVQPVRVAQRVGAPAGPRVRPAAQVTRNEKADVTFEVRAADGGAVVSAASGDLRITKSVQSTGEFTLQVTTARDTVTIAVTSRGTSVSRAKSKIDLQRGAADDGKAGAARRLLADSHAVLRYRGLADALIDADDRSPGALAIIIADATVGLLSGDVGAPRRIAQFLARRANANLRPAGMAIDCFYLMEQRMVEAWSDYVSCYISVSGDLLYTFYQQLCAARWTIQAESYWFSFLSCSGFNW